MLPPNLGRCSIPTCQNIIRKLSPTFFFIEEMHMTTAHAKSGRIDVRASAAAKQLLQEAARAAHKSVGEFLLDTGIVAANKTLADRTHFELTPEKRRAFQAALDRPVKSKAKLKKLLNVPA